LILRDGQGTDKIGEMREESIKLSGRHLYEEGKREVERKAATLTDRGFTENVGTFKLERTSFYSHY